MTDAPWEPTEVERELSEMRKQKDDAYLERNRVVAALASCYPSGIAKTAIPGWSKDWHGCVYIDLPTGQVSWHYHDSHAHLFAGLPPYDKPWDGHTTEEKYRRLEALSGPEMPDAPSAGEGLWCVNITGPDDILPARSYADACAIAHQFNNWWLAKRVKPGHIRHGFDPYMWAAPIPWPGTLYEHADALAREAAGDGEYAAIIGEARRYG